MREGLEPLTSLHEMAQSSSFRNKLHKLFLKNASFAVARLEKSLQEQKETSHSVLIQGLNEQKISLENCESTEHLFGVSDEEQKQYFNFAKTSQDYPLKAVSSFEELFEQELQSNNGEQQDAKTQLETLKWFQAGLQEAEKAKELLSKERISWEKVTQRQKKAIDYWEKALSLGNPPPQSGGQNGSSSSDQNQQPSEQDQEQNEQESQGGQKDTEIAQADSQQEMSPSMEDSTEDFKKEQESRDLLQHLQEMQKNDELAPQQKQKVKRGLRPW